ncbi:hypothetical protein [Massilia sp. S19_KUP03_FR1]|uniref:hypothetical protein n=1 Tax=Massilia sp. S19_KUP03_FR1 TaxID=3025503 RepID=UPI002FCDA7FE
MDEQQRLLVRLPDFLNGHVDGEDARRMEALLKEDTAWNALNRLRRPAASRDCKKSSRVSRCRSRQLDAHAPPSRAPRCNALATISSAREALEKKRDSCGLDRYVDVEGGAVRSGREDSPPRAVRQRNACQNARNMHCR